MSLICSFGASRATAFSWTQRDHGKELQKVLNLIFPSLLLEALGSSQQESTWAHSANRAQAPQHLPQKLNLCNWETLEETREPILH